MGAYVFMFIIATWHTQIPLLLVKRLPLAIVWYMVNWPNNVPMQRALFAGAPARHVTRTCAINQCSEYAPGQIVYMTLRGILPALATPNYCTTPDWRLQPSLCSRCTTPRPHNRRNPHAQIRVLVEEIGAGAAAVTDAMMSATCSFGAPSSEASCSQTLAERSDASVCTTARLHSIIIQSCCRSVLNLSSSCSKTVMALECMALLHTWCACTPGSNLVASSGCGHYTACSRHVWSHVTGCIRHLFTGCNRPDSAV